MHKFADNDKNRVYVWRDYQILSKLNDPLEK